MRQLWILIVAAWVTVGCLQAQDLTQTADDGGGLPIPSEKSLSDGVESLKRIFPKEYDAIGQGSEQAQASRKAFLARTILKTAHSTSPSDPLYFPMMSEVVRLAREADDTKACLEAIDLLAKSYDFDRAASKAALLSHLSSPRVRISVVRDASREIGTILVEATQYQKLDAAEEILEAGEKIAKRVLDRKLQSELEKAREIVAMLREQEDAFKEASKVLERQPSNSDANLTVAKFYGLRFGDWETAESYAAEVDNEDIRHLFVREAAGPATVDETFKLAEDWWTFSASLEGAENLQAKEVAVASYFAVKDDVEGLNQRKVESRLKLVEATHVVPLRVEFRAETGIAGSSDPAKLKGLVQAFSFDKKTTGFVKNEFRIRDVSGKGSDGFLRGTESGAQIRKGIAGDCLQPYGSNHLAFADSHLPFGRNPRTVTFWMRASNQIPHRGILFRYGKETINDAIILIAFEPNNASPHVRRTLTVTQFGEPKPSTHPSSRTLVTDDRWHHIAVSYDGEILRIFIDGNLENSAPLRKDTTQMGYAIIGNLVPGDKDHGYTGLIDEFMVFDRELTANEIKGLYNAFASKASAE